MNRRTFIGSTATAVLGAAAAGQTAVEEKKTESKTVVSLLQSQYAAGPATANPFHPGYRDADLEWTMQKNSDNILRMLQQAGERKSDIACTTEDILGLYPCMMDLDHPERFADHCEPIPGPFTDRLGRMAAKYNMYVIACFFEKEAGSCYNTAVLLDRKGRIEGRYRKVQLPAPETWVCKPGDSFPVFNTDFARIGMAICYDMVFPEVASCYALQGVELLFHPTSGFGWTEDLGINTVKVRAADHTMWIAVGKNGSVHAPGRSCIINPLGQVVADGGYDLDTVLTAFISPQQGWLQPEYAYGTAITGVADMRARLCLERKPEMYKLITDPKPLLATMHDDKKLIRGADKAAQRAVIEKMRKQLVREAQDTEPKTGLTRVVL